MQITHRTNAIRLSLTRARLSHRAIGSLVVVWGILILIGWYAISSYGATPGDAGGAPEVWPSQSSLTRDVRPTLLVFVHPKCPCSSASLSELERLMATCSNEIDAHVVFIAPGGTDINWRNSTLYKSAIRIPGVTVESDLDRQEASLFGARTSGYCLLYGADGKLQFQGGLTATRGHEGANDGAHAIQSALSGSNNSLRATPVFGCPLFESDASFGPAADCAPMRPADLP